MSAEINIYNPEALGPPMGQYTHVTRVRANEFLFIAGMLSGDAAGNVIGEGDFDLAIQMEDASRAFRCIAVYSRGGLSVQMNATGQKNAGKAHDPDARDLMNQPQRESAHSYVLRGRCARSGVRRFQSIEEISDRI